MLVLQDRQDLVETLDFKDQRVSQEIPVLQARLDLLVSQDRLDHLVPEVSLDQAVSQDRQERLVELVRPGQPGPVVTTGFQVQLEQEGRLVRMDHLVFRDFQGCEAIRVNPDHRASPDRQDQWVPLALEETLVQEEPQDSQAPLARLDPEEMLVCLDLVVRLDHLEHLEHREALVELEDLVPPVQAVQPVQRVWLDSLVSLDLEETLEQLAHQGREEILDHLVRQDLRVLKDQQDLWVLQDPRDLRVTLAHLGQQEELVHWVQLGREETLDLRVPLAHQDRSDLLDQLDRAVMSDRLVSPVLLDPLGLRVPREMQARKDLLGPLEVQERLEVLGQLDQAVHLGLLDLVDRRDSPVLQVLVGMLDQWVRQDHPDQQVSQDHPVSQVQEEIMVFLVQLAPSVNKVRLVDPDH